MPLMTRHRSPSAAIIGAVSDSFLPASPSVDDVRVRIIAVCFVMFGLTTDALRRILFLFHDCADSTIASERAISAISFQKIFKKYTLLQSQFFSDKVFGAFNINRNGYVGMPEFVVGHCVCRLGCREDKILFTFSMFDYDGDGSLTCDEFLTVMEEIHALTGSSGFAEGARILFQLADRSHNGSVDEDEFSLRFIPFMALLAPVSPVNHANFLWKAVGVGDGNTRPKLKTGDEVRRELGLRVADIIRNPSFVKLETMVSKELELIQATVEANVKEPREVDEETCMRTVSVDDIAAVITRRSRESSPSTVLTARECLADPSVTSQILQDVLLSTEQALQNRSSVSSTDSIRSPIHMSHPTTPSSNKSPGNFPALAPLSPMLPLSSGSPVISTVSAPVIESSDSEYSSYSYCYTCSYSTSPSSSSGSYSYDSAVSSDESETQSGDTPPGPTPIPVQEKNMNEKNTRRPLM